jgi:DNA-binding MarR family transcriptional regulator
MSGHIKRLERAGWIERSRSEDGDGRRTGLKLSANGREALDAIRRSRNDWLATRLAALSEQERGLLAAAAGTIARLTEDRP